MYLVSRRSGFANAYWFRLQQTIHWGYNHEILCYRKSVSSWWIFLFCVWVRRSMFPSSSFCTFSQLKSFAEKVEDSSEASPVSLVFHKLETQPWSYVVQFVCRQPGWAGRASSLLSRGLGLILPELYGFVSLHVGDKWTDQIPKQRSPQSLDSADVCTEGEGSHPRRKTDHHCRGCKPQTHHIPEHGPVDAVQRTD